MKKSRNEKPVWKKFLGIISHLFTFIIVFWVISIIWRDSYIAAFIYMILFISWYITILWAYCSKCPCHFNCTHVYMGWVASKIFKTKKTSRSSIDYVINTLLLIALLIYPQFWLKDHFIIIISFWIIMIALGPVIMPVFCPECENTSCPVHHFFKKK